MKKRDGHIAVCPAGRMEKGLLDAIAKGITERFGITASVSMELGDLMFAHNKERNQYHSTAILEKLSEMAPPSAVKVIAVTHVDLFIPILTYVHGEAQLGGKACIISTFRLRGEEQEGGYIERMAKEAVHELCHTFDLRHCKDPTCVMHFCRNAKEVDRRSDALCRYCSIMFEDQLKRLSAREAVEIETVQAPRDRNREHTPDRGHATDREHTTDRVTPLKKGFEEDYSTDRNQRIVARQGSSM